MNGECIPRFYRIAYLDLCSFCYTCYPIGIHLIARIVRRIWEWSFCYRSSRIERIVERAIAKERSESYQRGLAHGMSECFRELAWIQSESSAQQHHDAEQTTEDAG